ncbi:catalase family peroxidase [Acetobacter sp.]|jgi:catalase|uniref:catalase family peroxidase n=1 Tax=Acetobacter sp. TaxID=440 RepID=UPI0025C4E526|nr:catalase family peroxidase [Acetobacter sp.]MCH4090492.1 catalase family peroxidase [Acetobacter sp.]MCI1299186.1 catalase family peroxidase [Acetobacter sp.]MCI1315733.1 catalase family peroxidase [Acetobacter sp.]
MATKPVVPPASVLRWFGVVAGPAVLLSGFLWAGGWLPPHHLTQKDMLDALRAVDGVHPGFRRNHAKGVCVTGWFEGNGHASDLSSAPVLSGGRVPVSGRFALAGGMPFQPDAPAKVRSMALRLVAPDGQEWRMGMNDIPVFPVRTPQEFHDLQLAARPEKTTGKPDPLRIQAFRDGHPWLKSPLEQIAHRSLTSGFADDTYRSLDSFLFVDNRGTKTAVRWAMVPVQTTTPPEGHADDHNYLFHRLIEDIHARPLQWHLMVTVAGSHDPVADPSQAWAAEDRQVDAGLLTLNTVESEEDGACTGITFDPLVLPAGIAPSADPILQARSGTYMRSFSLRSGEKAPVPAITPAMTMAAIDREEKAP